MHRNPAVGRMDEPDSTESNPDVNLGLKKRAFFTNESKVMGMIGRLIGDFFNQQTYLLDMEEVRMSKNKFCLMRFEIDVNFNMKVRTGCCFVK